MIEVILTQSKKNIGEKNSVIKVKDGYGKYLIAQGIAILGNSKNKKNLAEILLQSERKEKAIRLEKEKIARQLDGIQLVFSERVDESGTLFGTITSLKIAKAYQLHNIVIEAKQINIINPPIKKLGMHQAILTLHKDLTKTVAFEVQSTS